MIRKLYIYILLSFFFLDKDINFNSLDIFSFNLNNSEKKSFLVVFNSLKIKFNSQLKLYKDDNISYLASFCKSMLSGDDDLSIQHKNNFFFFKITLSNYNFSLKNNFQMFDLYKFFFVDSLQVKNPITSKYYFNMYGLKKKNVAILLLFFLKKDFFKLLNLITCLSYLNSRTLLVSDGLLHNEASVFNEYSDYLSFEDSYSHIILINPFIKLKKFYSLKDLDIPIISILDDTLNPMWFDYYLYVKKVDEFSIFFFFNLFLIYFFLGQKLKKKNQTIQYNNFYKLNILKEYLFKSTFK